MIAPTFGRRRSDCSEEDRARINALLEEHNENLEDVRLTTQCLEGARTARLFTQEFRRAVQRGDEFPIVAACGATDGVITPEKLIDHWNGFLRVAVGNQSGSDAHLFGGAVRDRIRGMIPNDFDVFVQVAQADDAAIKCLKRILHFNKECYITANIVEMKKRYSIASSQLRIRAEHPYNPIFSINADITFGTSFKTNFDFNINGVCEKLPMKDFIPSVHRVQILASGYTDVDCQQAIEDIKKCQMRRACGNEHTISSPAQDDRAKMMLEKGFKDVTEYTCGKFECVRASVDAKKKWIERQFAANVAIGGLRLSCIADFHTDVKHLDPLRKELHEEAENERLEEHLRTCNVDDCRECDYRQYAGEELSGPMLLTDSFALSIISFVNLRLQEFRDGLHAELEDHIEKNNVDVWKPDEGSEKIRAAWTEKAQTHVARILADKPAVCDEFIALLKAEIEEITKEHSSRLMNEEQVIAMALEPFHTYRKRTLWSAPIVDYVKCEVVLRMTPGKLVGIMSAQDVIATYHSRVNSFLPGAIENIRSRFLAGDFDQLIKHKARAL